LYTKIAKQFGYKKLVSRAKNNLNNLYIPYTLVKWDAQGTEKNRIT